MKLTRKARNNNIWEIWNEWAAESVYFRGGKPNAAEVREIVKKESFGEYDSDLDGYIKQYIHVDKLPHLYETALMDPATI